MVEFREIVHNRYILRRFFAYPVTGEDWKIGRCLHLAGASMIDTRDVMGRETMLVFGYKTYLQGSFPKWYYQWDQHGSLSVSPYIDYLFP